MNRIDLQRLRDKENRELARSETARAVRKTMDQDVQAFLASGGVIQQCPNHGHRREYVPNFGNKAQREGFTRRCAHCGDWYPANQITSRYCGGKCKNAAFYEKRAKA